VDGLAVGLALEAGGAPVVAEVGALAAEDVGAGPAQPLTSRAITIVIIDATVINWTTNRGFLIISLLLLFFYISSLFRFLDVLNPRMLSPNFKCIREFNRVKITSNATVKIHIMSSI
jgi:hypothetical protein